MLNDSNSSRFLVVSSLKSWVAIEAAESLVKKMISGITKGKPKTAIKVALFPALEAMSLGKPVLAARTSSFPEVVGDAGMYFDPLSVSEFATAFQEIHEIRKLAELASKSAAQSAKFNWARMAKCVAQWVCP